jgi:hypothetical protein
MSVMFIDSPPPRLWLVFRRKKVNGIKKQYYVFLFPFSSYMYSSSKHCLFFYLSFLLNDSVSTFLCPRCGVRHTSSPRLPQLDVRHYTRHVTSAKLYTDVEQYIDKTRHKERSTIEETDRYARVFWWFGVRENPPQHGQCCITTNTLTKIP